MLRVSERVWERNRGWPFEQLAEEPDSELCKTLGLSPCLLWNRRPFWHTPAWDKNWNNHRDNSVTKQKWCLCSRGECIRFSMILSQLASLGFYFLLARLAMHARTFLLKLSFEIGLVELIQRLGLGIWIMEWHERVMMETTRHRLILKSVSSG